MTELEKLAQRVEEGFDKAAKMEPEEYGAKLDTISVEAEVESMAQNPYIMGTIGGILAGLEQALGPLVRLIDENIILCGVAVSIALARGEQNA